MRKRKVKPPKEENKDCVCAVPDFGEFKPRLKHDGTYFSYCKTCGKFRDVPNPEDK